MAKIFVVTSGDYSSYTVDRVFSTEELAKEWIGISKGYTIEEYKLDDMSNPNTLKSMCCVFHADGNGLRLYRYEESTHDSSDKFQLCVDTFRNMVVIYSFLPPDYEKERCIRVMSDTLAQLKVKFPISTWSSNMHFNIKTLERIL
jgi:hypothetical protein